MVNGDAPAIIFDTIVRKRKLDATGIFLLAFNIVFDIVCIYVLLTKVYDTRILSAMLGFNTGTMITIYFHERYIDIKEVPCEFVFDRYDLVFRRLDTNTAVRYPYNKIKRCEYSNKTDKLRINNNSFDTNGFGKTIVEFFRKHSDIDVKEKNQWWRR